MANLIDTSKWNMTNATNNGESFTLINGQMRQSIKLPGETKYKLNFNCTELVDLKSYFLFKVVALGGKHTYLLPVTFLGENTIEVELVEDIRTIELFIIGSLTVTDIGLYEDGALTESQKDAIGKVENESDKWDRINEVTNEQGNLIASRLEGSINNALNSIFGGNGTMEIIDGTIIFRDKDKDANSTMAMRLNFGGLAIADSKKVDGTWDWKTFGTGQGFTADYLNAGTLSAITIDGVTITATDILGGTITGAIFDGGTLKNGSIKASTLEGVTIYVGDKASGNYIELSPNNPLKVIKNNILVSSLGYSNVGGGKLTIYDVGGQEAFKVECLEDGNLRLYGNDTPGFIPDPDHPGFVIPNPKPRYMEIKSGRVVFDEGSAGVMRDGYFRRFVDIEELSRKASPRFHTHTTSYSSSGTMHNHDVYSSSDIITLA